jgi:hypothetical protein
VPSKLSATPEKPQVRFHSLLFSLLNAVQNLGISGKDQLQVMYGLSDPCINLQKYGITPWRPYSSSSDKTRIANPDLLNLHSFSISKHAIGTRVTLRNLHLRVWSHGVVTGLFISPSSGRNGNMNMKAPEKACRIRLSRHDECELTKFDAKTSSDTMFSSCSIVLIKVC